MGPNCALAMALALVSTIVQLLGCGLPAMLRYLGRRRTRANARGLEFSRGDFGLLSPECRVPIPGSYESREVKSPPLGCGVQPGHSPRTLSRLLTSPSRHRTLSRRLLFPLSLIFRARTLSPFGYPFPFPSLPFICPSTLLCIFSLPMRQRA